MNNLQCTCSAIKQNDLKCEAVNVASVKETEDIEEKKSVPTI